MRTDRDLHRFAAAYLRKPLLRNSHLRRRTPPEQVRWRGRNDQEVRRKRIQSSLRLFRRDVIVLRIDQQWFVSCFTNFVVSEQQLERIVRIMAPEIGRALEIPVRIDERKLHAAPGRSCKRMLDTGSGVVTGSNTSRF